MVNEFGKGRAVLLNFSVFNAPAEKLIASLLAGAGMALAVVLGPGAANGGPDWPVWRGSNHDGVSTEKGLLTTWPADG